jgi:transcriptional regulator of acetoin/glycerol metabolism
MHHGWNISKAAEALEISRVTLYSKIKHYDLSVAVDRNGGSQG